MVDEQQPREAGFVHTAPDLPSFVSVLRWPLLQLRRVSENPAARAGLSGATNPTAPPVSSFSKDSLKRSLGRIVLASGQSTVLIRQATPRNIASQHMSS